jgi:hypothetical protein
MYVITNIIMFTTTISRSFADSMAEFTDKVLNDAIERLSIKYSFDKDEAKSFLMSGGVQVKLPVLEMTKLPWTGVVDESCCRAILRNDGLFTQCQRPFVNGTSWCKKCEKDVEKNGTPSNGDVDARLVVDVMKYKVGKFEVKPYIEYMEKKGITQKQVDEAVQEYGLTIDPRQYEKKKRGRRTKTTRAMTPGLAAESTTEDEPAEDEPAEASRQEEPEPAEASRQEEPEPAEASRQEEPEPAEDEPAEDEEEELDEDDYVPPTLTIQGINEMTKPDLLKVCTFYNLNTSLPLKKLRAELKTKVV